VIKRSRTDTLFDILNITLLTLLLIAVAYPLIFVASASISNPVAVNNGQVWLLPQGITFQGYERIFSDRLIWTGYANTLLYTVVGTTINVVVTLLCGYALSRKDLVGRDGLMMLFVFTLFFSGGIIPLFLVVRQFGMLNSVWAMVLPNAMSVINMIIARTFFRANIPDELLDSARIDGCSNTQFFMRIVLPLSQPLIAIMVLFYAVEHWNSYFNGLIFISQEQKYPLQLILRNILISNQLQSDMVADANLISERQLLGESIKYGVIIVASLPILLLYPFLQRYFVKGIMVGSIKG
jgi:putative aldouronate transport system permease protein